jgi:glycosyltransferase involved in cell wall biosynthesis
VKILHIITSLDVGGAQTMLYQLLKAGKDNQHDQMVVSLTGQGPVSKDIRALDIRVQELELRRWGQGPGSLWKLFRIIRDYRPDLVQTWLYHADLIGGLAARLSSRGRVVWGVHHTLTTANSLKSATFLVARLNALLSRFIPARIVCCSQTALETHARLGYREDKMLMIPNGTDITRFRPDSPAGSRLRSALGLPERAKVIGMFSRFHPQKDHHTLILAAGILLEEMPDVHFLLAGEGIDNDNRQLKDWIANAGVADNIHLLGLRQDTPLLYAALDVFTLSSSHGEALPLVLCEAMACGIPCVATDVGDAARVLGDTGLCVPVNDPASLSRAWKAILDGPDSEYERLSHAARKRIEDHYDFDLAAVKYNHLYEAIVS